jgi:hypothetical protein
MNSSFMELENRVTRVKFFQWSSSPLDQLIMARAPDFYFCAGRIFCQKVLNLSDRAKYFQQLSWRLWETYRRVLDRVQ